MTGDFALAGLFIRCDQLIGNDHVLNQKLYFSGCLKQRMSTRGRGLFIFLFCLFLFFPTAALIMHATCSVQGNHNWDNYKVNIGTF